VRVIEIADSLDAPKNEFFIVRPKTTLEAGWYKLSVDFEGSLRQPELVGIYSSSYTVPNTKPAKPVTTK
jgi:Peptidase M1 N-terminal domain